MKKFYKILAVIMAVMMLVTMATACKNSDEDEFGDVFEDGGSLGGEITDNGNTDNGTTDNGTNDGYNDDNSYNEDNGYIDNGGNIDNGFVDNNNGFIDNNGTTDNGGDTNTNVGDNSNNTDTNTNDNNTGNDATDSETPSDGATNTEKPSTDNNTNKPADKEENNKPSGDKNNTNNNNQNKPSNNTQNNNTQNNNQNNNTQNNNTQNNNTQNNNTQNNNTQNNNTQNNNTQNNNTQNNTPNNNTQNNNTQNNNTPNNNTQNNNTQNNTPNNNTQNNNPSTNNPSTNNPSTNNPGTNNPGTNNPGTNNPGTNNPGANNPGTNQPGADVNTPSNTPSDNDKPADTPTKEEVIEQYDATKKYDMTNNPLVYEGKPHNTGFEISFDIDTTGFVKNNIKVADLKGKTLNLITGVMYGVFEFKNEKGEYLSEWDWFDACKKTYGVNVKYIKSRFDKADQQALTFMNAGKALDIIGTHVGGFPTYLNLSRPLDPYINIQNLGNSPGVCEMTLQQSKWGGSYRCISAIGAVNVLWYNETLVKQFNLPDPHTLWKEDNWNWDTYASFMKAVPKTTPEGKELFSFHQCDGDIWYAWALSNGVNPLEVDTKSSTPNIINNWMDPKTIAAWEFISGVNKATNYGGSFGNLYSDGTVLMHDATNMNPNFDSHEYGKTHKYNWVPWPAATTDTGRCIAFNYGFCQMLARKMKNESNAPYAVKFMEMWATRFCEANYDFLSQNTSIAMTYEDKKDHFEFCISNTYFALQKIAHQMITGDNAKLRNQWLSAFKNPQYNITTETTAMKNIIDQSIKDCLAFGL